MQQPSDGHLIQLGNMLLDSEQMRLKKNEEWLDVPILSYKLLMALIEQPGKVISSDHLISAVWGKQVVTDENLQQRIRIVRKMLADSEQSISYIGTVRGKGYRLLIEPLIISSESKFSNNESVETEEKSESLNSTTKIEFFRLKKNVYLVATFILLSALAVILNYFNVDKTTGTDIAKVSPRVAVLPFTSSDSQVSLEKLEGLDDGLTEQVIQGLSGIKNLQVIAYASVFGYKNTVKPLAKIASELDVDKVLVGNISYGKYKIEINLSLYNVYENRLTWQKKLALKSDQLALFSNQSLPEIAEQLGVNYVVKPLGINTYDEAYRLYLKGRKHYLKYNRLDNQIASNLFRQSLASSPAFALALCGLSNALSQQVHQYDGEYHVAEEALRLANAAVNLQPDLAEAHKAKGFALDSLGDYEEAIVAYQKAITLNPNYVDAMLNKAVLDWESGDIAGAYQLVNKVIVLDPLEIFGYLLKAEILAFVGDFKSAELMFAKLHLHHPEKLVVSQGRAQFYFDQGKYGKSLQYGREILSYAPSYTSAQILVADSLLYLGDAESARVSYQRVSQVNSYKDDGYAELRLKLIDGQLNSYELTREDLIEKDTDVTQFLDTVEFLLIASHLAKQPDFTATTVFSKMIDKNRVTVKAAENDPHLEGLRQAPEFSKLMNKLKSIKRSQLKSLTVQSVTPH